MTTLTIELPDEVYETLRRMINRLVTDLIDTSAERLRSAGIKTAADVRMRSAPLIGFSDSTGEANQTLKSFLREHVYKHYKVQRMTSKARRVISTTKAIRRAPACCRAFAAIPNSSITQRCAACLADTILIWPI